MAHLRVAHHKQTCLQGGSEIVGHLMSRRHFSGRRPISAQPGSVAASILAATVSGSTIEVKCPDNGAAAPVVKFRTHGAPSRPAVNGDGV